MNELREEFSSIYFPMILKIKTHKDRSKDTFAELTGSLFCAQEESPAERGHLTSPSDAHSEENGTFPLVR